MFEYDTEQMPLALGPMLRLSFGRTTDVEGQIRPALLSVAGETKAAFPRFSKHSVVWSGSQTSHKCCPMILPEMNFGRGALPLIRIFATVLGSVGLFDVS